MGKNNRDKSKRNNVQKQSGDNGGGRLSTQKRSEVNEIVKKLLKLTSQITQHDKVNGEVSAQIDRLLEKVQEIEPVLEISQIREDRFGELVNWVQSNGGITEAFTIDEFENMEYGLKASSDLKEGELICAVPRKAMLTLTNVEESPLKSLLSNDPMLQHMGNIALALFLILESIKGENSFWYPYISSLPRKYNTVLYFTATDLLELKGSPTLELVLKQRKNIARQYAYFNQVFQTSHDEASEILKNVFTYQLYRWAVSTVMTRQNFIPTADNERSINALIPLWDMCNHSNGHITTEFNNGRDRSECLAFRPFAKGEQVLIFYGTRSNADFLVHNGFVYPENIHDTYRLRLGISKADPLHAARTDLLNRLGIPSSGEFLVCCGPQPIDGRLLAFLRIFNMDDVHLQHWIESERWNDLMCYDCALDTQIESKTWNFLAARIGLLLSAYPKNVKVDEIDESPCRRLARQQSELEKKLLNSALEYVQQRIKL